ncbi:MAG: amidase [Pseudomonadota bacterium]
MAAEILSLDAVTLRDRIATGALTATDLAEAYLAQIAAEEPKVQAWAWHDPGYVRAQAAELDRYRKTGRPLGALHGLPVGLKDVIDTAKIPTQNGCDVDKGRVPLVDAFVVKQLKANGAVILGKTVTTELAFMQPGPTRNPHNLDHTPGGSSSGSAAAVAAAMAPLTIGTQTGGSIIRPASFCGVCGFKPTFGAIPRTGALKQSQTLDTLGVFGRTPNDAAMFAEVLFGADEGDAATALAPHPKLLDTVNAGAPLPPVFAFVKPPGWDQADEDTRQAFEQMAKHLSDQVFEAPLPSAFGQAAHQRGVINFAEMARNYYTYGKSRDQLGPKTVEGIEAGEAISARDYLSALDWQSILTAGLDEIFERCDAILTPAALGPAPKGLDSTGDSIFNGMWTFCGTPAVTIPVLTAENGLPMGVQLVGPKGSDGRLLRTADWLWQSLTQGETA